MEKRTEVTVVVEDLFPLFLEQPQYLPKEWHREIEAAKHRAALARIVCDYIAGMTDRFAIQEHERLFANKT